MSDPVRVNGRYVPRWTYYYVLEQFDAQQNQEVDFDHREIVSRIRNTKIREDRSGKKDAPYWKRCLEFGNDNVQDHRARIFEILAHRGHISIDAVHNSGIRHDYLVAAEAGEFEYTVNVFFMRPIWQHFDEYPASDLEDYHSSRFSTFQLWDVLLWGCRVESNPRRTVKLQTHGAVAERDRSTWLPLLNQWDRRKSLWVVGEPGGKFDLTFAALSHMYDQKAQIGSTESTPPLSIIFRMLTEFGRINRRKTYLIPRYEQDGRAQEVSPRLWTNVLDRYFDLEVGNGYRDAASVHAAMPSPVRGELTDGHVTAILKHFGDLPSLDVFREQQYNASRYYVDTMRPMEVTIQTPLPDGSAVPPMAGLVRPAN
ncbi:MAG: hypothetical protein M4579_002449 [Chaenotheca gracillima]|nr:MAG: hypothetical protein M4579_002449 [Chaenotheca gracillima]